MTLQAQAAYWDDTWKGRICENGVAGNALKFQRIADYLWSRSHLFNLRKLDVGCGPARHAVAISRFIPSFAETWVGVDLSAAAIKYAWDNGLRAYVADFLTLNPKEWGKFDVFFFWDTLEHFEDLQLVAAKVKELAADKFVICGNVPLFVGKLKEGGVEKPININILRRFLVGCSCTTEWIDVYGTDGWPFLMFESEGSL